MSEIAKPPAGCKLIALPQRGPPLRKVYLLRTSGVTWTIKVGQVLEEPASYNVRSHPIISRVNNDDVLI